MVDSFSPAAGGQRGGVLVQLVGRHFRPPLAVDTTAAGALPALACRFGSITVQGTVGSDEPIVATVAARLYVPSPVPDENGTVCNNGPGPHAAPCAVWCYSPARTVGAVPIELTFNGQVPLVITPCICTRYMHMHAHMHMHMLYAYMHICIYAYMHTYCSRLYAQYMARVWTMPSDEHHLHRGQDY
jgi:hypothetical protein